MTVVHLNRTCSAKGDEITIHEWLVDKDVGGDNCGLFQFTILASSWEV
jgi:hypothetical protein